MNNLARSFFAIIFTINICNAILYGIYIQFILYSPNIKLFRPTTINYIVQSNKRNNSAPPSLQTMDFFNMLYNQTYLSSRSSDQVPYLVPSMIPTSSLRIQTRHAWSTIIAIDMTMIIIILLKYFPRLFLNYHANMTYILYYYNNMPE